VDDIRVKCSDDSFDLGSTLSRVQHAHGSGHFTSQLSVVFVQQKDLVVRLQQVELLPNTHVLTAGGSVKAVDYQDAQDAAPLTERLRSEDKVRSSVSGARGGCALMSSILVNTGSP
jgi:hypothetical protein